MNWIELVVIRTPDRLQKQAACRLMNQLTQEVYPDGLGSIRIYSNSFVETDVCVHLQWNMQGSEPGRSDLGIQLAAALEAFGRVHHTLWIEENVSKRREDTVQDQIGFP